MKNSRLSRALLIPTVMTGLFACNDNNSSTPAPTPTAVVNTVNVTGSVAAINGQIAFYSPDMADHILAGLFGKKLHASVPGEQSVGAGVSVNLLEVDDNGATVGAVIASAVTDASGNYSLDAPDGFVPGSQYLVRADGNGNSIDARVTSLTADIDTISDASSSIIATNAMILGELSTDEITEIHAAVADIVESTDAVATSVADYRSAIVSAASDDESVSNVVSSTVAVGEICGTVSDSSGAALENIRIVVRDFGNWVTRAKTKTDAAGNYCLNVPVAGDADAYIPGKIHSGEYILGALNFTGNSYAASQWWTTSSSNSDGSGGANSQFKAEKITVSSTTSLSRNLVLDANGSRITGTVTGVGGVSVEGMRVVIRNYDTFKPLASAKVKADNTYRINVKATDYLISFRNQTRHPFASEIYRAGTDGVNNRNMASRETMIANTDHIYDAVLDSGVVISGIVKDNAAAPVSGQVVYVNNYDGGRIEALRTNKSGKFRLWVNPRLNLGDTTAGAYTVWSRGQARSANTNGDDDITATDYKLSTGSGLVFDDQTIEVSGTLVSSDATPVAVSAAVMRLKSSFGTDMQVSAGDGSFKLYTSDTTNTALKVYVRMDGSVDYGSGVYDGSAISTISITAGAAIDGSGGNVSLGTISMPTKGVGSGVGYVEGNAGAGSTNVQFRIGGVLGTDSMFGTLSRGDGSFKVTVPSATYNRVRSQAGAGSNCDNVTVAADATVTLTYHAVDAPVCN
ncbi:MAG: hypothetical protein OEY36_09530 [Gammaproteobacteria bacterium]|nr:hypothetical protein [Gammaproteobacteria bacterium]